MKRRIVPYVVLAMGTGVVAHWIIARGDYQHVVLVTLDATAPDHLGPYDHARDVSPYLDAIATESVVFDDAIAAHPNPAAAHASIHTGLRVAAHGVARNGDRLRAGVQTLAQRLRSAGYRTGAFVSHDGLAKKHTGLDRGFMHYDDRVGRGGREGRRTVRAAIDWLKGEAHHREPNFVWVHLPGPRDHLRELVEGLAWHGYWDETLLIITAHHGESLNHRNEPHGSDTGADELQPRVPLMFRFANGRGAGVRVGDVVHHFDLMPTLFDIFELERGPSLAGRSLAGRSLLPAIDGDATLPTRAASPKP